MLNGKILSGGEFELENKALKYIRQAYFSKNESDTQIDYYEYELFENGKLVAIYRADRLNSFYALTKKINNDKVTLIYGSDYLNIIN